MGDLEASVLFKGIWGGEYGAMKVVLQALECRSQAVFRMVGWLAHLRAKVAST